MTRERMVVLLYEKSISDLEEALRCLESGDRSGFTKKVNHSQRIVAELRGALDPCDRWRHRPQSRGDLRLHLPRAPEPAGRPRRPARALLHRCAHAAARGLAPDPQRDSRGRRARPRPGDRLARILHPSRRPARRLRLPLPVLPRPKPRVCGRTSCPYRREMSLEACLTLNEELTESLRQAPRRRRRGRVRGPAAAARPGPDRTRRRPAGRRAGSPDRPAAPACRRWPTPIAHCAWRRKPPWPRPGTPFVPIAAGPAAALQRLIGLLNRRVWTSGPDPAPFPPYRLTAAPATRPRQQRCSPETTKLPAWGVSFVGDRLAGAGPICPRPPCAPGGASPRGRPSRRPRPPGSCS
jgi:hypothetical protein